MEQLEDRRLLASGDPFDTAADAIILDPAEASVPAEIDYAIDNGGSTSKVTARVAETAVEPGISATKDDSLAMDNPHSGESLPTSSWRAGP